MDDSDEYELLVWRNRQWEHYAVFKNITEAIAASKWCTTFFMRPYEKPEEELD